MDWKSVCQDRIRERNQIEKYPYKLIYDSNYLMYQENRLYDKVHTEVKTQLALLHHELTEYSSRGDYQGGASLCNQRLYVIEEELRRKYVIQGEESEEDKVVVSRLVSNLKKQVSNQKDELDIAKSELQVYQERVVQLEKELENVKATKVTVFPGTGLAIQQHPIKDRRPSATTTRR